MDSTTGKVRVTELLKQQARKRKVEEDANVLENVSDRKDADLAALIRRVFLQRAKDDDRAAATICDFPCSEMERDPDTVNFAEWYEQNSGKIRAGGEAEKAVEEVKQFCDVWLQKTRRMRSD